MAEEEELKKTTAVRVEDAEKQDILHGEIKQEIEIFVGAHLKQEGIEQERKEELVGP